MGACCAKVDEADEEKPSTQLLGAKAPSLNRAPSAPGFTPPPISTKAPDPPGPPPPPDVEEPKLAPPLDRAPSTAGFTPLSTKPPDPPGPPSTADDEPAKVETTLCEICYNAMTTEDLKWKSGKCNSCYDKERKYPPLDKYRRLDSLREVRSGC